jgi:hypothetical protein
MIKIEELIIKQEHKVHQVPKEQWVHKEFKVLHVLLVQQGQQVPKVKED